jgi:hypothetical protein
MADTMPVQVGTDERGAPVYARKPASPSGGGGGSSGGGNPNPNDAELPDGATVTERDYYGKPTK